MNNERQALVELSSNWRRKSGERLTAARHDLEGNMPEIAVNNLYYAMFYAAIAIMIIRGYKPFNKHAAVKTVFYHDFVKAKLVEKSYGRLYQQLFDNFHRADHDPIDSFDREELELLLEQVTRFLRVCDDLMHSSLSDRIS